MNKAISMISLATKAGKTVAGEFSVEKAIKEGKAKLVLVSTEASDNTKKKFSDKSAYYNVPYFEYGTRSELGLATGKGDRVSIAVLDDGFSNTIIKMLTDNK